MAAGREMTAGPMTARPTIDGDRALSTRLALARLATRATMVVERGWPLLLPLAVVASLFLSAAWLGLFARLPDMLRIGLAAAFGLAALAALYPLRLFRLPTAAEVDRRVEAANALKHNPLLTQTDRPSGSETGFSQALWREHQRRMAERLGRVGGDLPRPGVPERDPWALRAVAALLVVTAFAFSFGPRGGSVADAFRPGATHDVAPPRIDAWVTPPAYTGKPPVFLTADANRKASLFTVPEGSDVALRIAGGSGQEALSFADAAGKVNSIAATEPKGDAGQASPARPQKFRQFAAKLSRDGTLKLEAGGEALASWTFAVTPDKPPQIRFVGEPKRAANGTLELNYQVDDDYGAASAKAEFALADKPAPKARPLYGAPEMALTLPRRGGKTNAARTAKDLTEHVWAGSNVTVTLTAVDDAGHAAKSETKTLAMPERPFANPLARAVIEQRRLLALDANAKPRVLDLMDAITLRPEDTFDSMTHYLAIVSAETRLKLAASDEQLRDVVSYLWQVALGIEDGALSDAEKRLRQAQQALQDALKNGASDEEISRLMKELRQAMNDFLREFAERQKQNPNQAGPSQNMHELRKSDLDRMMDQIENLARSGSRDQAQQLLSQLQDMMNNLQAGKPQQGQQNDAMRQQMDKLGDLMRRQQEMMNETFRMDRMQRGDQGQQGADPFGDEQFGEDGGGQQPGEQNRAEGQGQGQGKPMTSEEFAEAMKQLQEGQGKLKDDLDQLKKALEGMGLQPNEGFGEAGKAMGEAESALGEGEGGRATGDQGRALQALRKGAQDMMKQLQAMQNDEGSGRQGERGQSSNLDPLGRPQRSTGPDNGDTVKVPDEIDVQRARQILDAIRKRLGNALSPEIERSYLERLLEMK